jgi:hypothetical protein
MIIWLKKVAQKKEKEEETQIGLGVVIAAAEKNQKNMLIKGKHIKNEEIAAVNNLLNNFLFNFT